MRMLAWVGLLCVGAASAAGALDALSQRDAVAGLKEALALSAGNAIGKLGAADGFLGDPQVRIALPGRLQDAQRLLQRIGLGAQAEELVTTMNRAAEAAVLQARPLLIDSAKQMTVQDAKSILTGGDDAGTQYFRRTVSDRLRAKFLPIVKQSTDRLQVATQYNALAGQASRLGLVDAKDASIESYVTDRALDGLFLTMANEERAIRKDPVGQASRLLQKVFGALKR